MSELFYTLLVLLWLSIPVVMFVLLLVLIILALSKKPVKKFIIGILIYIGATVFLSAVLVVLAVVTDPATWCNHDREVISETQSTCTEKGEIIEYCEVCDINVTVYKDMLPHNYQFSETIEATCTKPGYIVNKCTGCSSTQKTKTEVLGHSMKEVSRIDATTTSKGEIVSQCERCGKQEKVSLPKIKDTSTPKDDNYVTGEKVDGELSDITTDNIVEKLCSFGFTESEAQEIREIFLLCGVTSIDGAKPTDPKATIDGLVAYRWVMDDDRTLWFTIDNRELFYIALNGVDVYDTDKGGFLININDVHIPESEISTSVKNTLKDLTERTLDGYFTNAKYYDAWGMGRQDDDYMVQCEVYAANKLGVSDWIKAKVWFKYDGENYNVTGVVIDGVRYK